MEKNIRIYLIPLRMIYKQEPKFICKISPELKKWSLGQQKKDFYNYFITRDSQDTRCCFYEFKCRLLN